MSQYAIIEVDAGLTVVEVELGESPDDEALRLGGLLIDPGPYDSYEDACDAMLSIDDDEDEDE